MKVLSYSVCLIVVCSYLLGCASQRDVVILDERMMMLERQNQELQRQNSALQKKIANELERVGESSQSTETNLRSKYASMNADLDAVQQDVRLLSGRIDEMSHLLERKVSAYDAGSKQRQERIDELNLLVTKTDQRMTDIERYLNFDRTGTKVSGVGQGGSAAKDMQQANGDKKDMVQQLYADAKQAYDNGQMDKARQGFQQLLKDYPKSANADNAQFWIGETYYREKWYEKAILEYQAVIEKYPNGNKVAAAMLKQGMAFLQLGDKSNARLILKELEKKYPGSNEAKIAGKKLSEF